MKISRVSVVLSLLAAVLLAAVGCGNKNIAEVSGVVTIDGKPAPDISVSFQPVANADNGMASAPGSIGITDSEGRFVMEIMSSSKSGKGAGVGQNRVKLTPIAKGANGGAPLPGEARGEMPTFPWGTTQVETTFEVPVGGTKTANFALPLEGSTEDHKGI